jgi:hypothetical protein
MNKRLNGEEAIVEIMKRRGWSRRRAERALIDSLKSGLPMYDRNTKKRLPMEVVAAFEERFNAQTEVIANATDLLLQALATDRIRARVRTKDSEKSWLVPVPFWKTTFAVEALNFFDPVELLSDPVAVILWKMLEQSGTPPSLVMEFSAPDIKAAFPEPPYVSPPSST